MNTYSYTVCFKCLGVVACNIFEHYTESGTRLVLHLSILTRQHSTDEIYSYAVLTLLKLDGRSNFYICICMFAFC